VQGFLPGGASAGAAGAALLDATELLASTSVARRRVPKGPTLVVSTGVEVAVLVSKRRLPCECGGGAEVGAEVGVVAGLAEDIAEILDAHLAWTTCTMAAPMRGASARTRLASTASPLNGTAVGAM
jgi:hypothetical protein